MPDQSEDDPKGLQEYYELAKKYFSLASKYFYEKFSRFSLSGAGPEHVILAFFFLLISALLGGRTMTILGPFSNLELNLSISIAFVTLILGHYFAARLTQDGRWIWATIYLPLGLSIVLLLIAFGAFDYGSSFSTFQEIIGYAIIGQLSLLGGILSGAMKSAPWLGGALYSRHIQPRMKNENIHFLFWNTDGQIRLFESQEIEPIWNENSKTVLVRIHSKEYPFNYFSPVFVESHPSLRKLSSAQTRVAELFSHLPVAWGEAMAEYKEALDQGFSRVSWLFMLQLVIPTHAASLITQSGKIPGRFQRLDIEDESQSINWTLPKETWNSCKENLFQGPQENPALHSALMSTKKPQQPLEIEEQISISNLEKSVDDFGLAGTDLLRSYSHLMLMLYENISVERSTRSELCKQCIRSIGSWYSDFRYGDFIEEISIQTHYSSMRVSNNALSLDDWVNKFDHAFVEPTTTFLNLHDRLLNIVHNDEQSIQIQGSIQTLISDCTDIVMASGTKKPGTPKQQSNQTRLGRRRDSGIKRKAALLVGICKMELVHSLLSASKEASK